MCCGVLWPCRCAAEATNTVSAAKAGAEHVVLEKELAALREEVRQGCIATGWLTDSPVLDQHAPHMLVAQSCPTPDPRRSVFCHRCCLWSCTAYADGA